jgi:hypothetical protein
MEMLATKRAGEMLIHRMNIGNRSTHLRTVEVRSRILLASGLERGAIDEDEARARHDFLDMLLLEIPPSHVE